MHPSVKIFLTLLASISISLSLHAQESPFNAGVVLGINAAQVDGDDAAGYTKLGLKAGIQGVINIKERWNIVLEFLYSQRGAQDDQNDFGIDGIYSEINLNYFELPVYVELMDWKVDDYYKMHFIAGLTAGLLRDAEIIGLNHTVDLLNERDLSFLAGIDFYANQHLGFGIRWNFSINQLYETGTDGTMYKRLRGHFLSFHSHYRIK